MAGVCSGPGPCDTTPFGSGDNWVNKVGGLPLYIRAVAKAFMAPRGKLSESEAIQRAIGVVKNWAEGKGNVTPETRARAAAAVAEWERKKAQAHSLTAAAADTVDLAFTESLHPRGQKGSANGGKFVAKNGNSASAPPANMAANVRDFQKRNHLPVTGVIDSATAAKISAVRAAKAGGGKGRKAKKHTKAAARKAAAVAKRHATAVLRQHVATVNAMMPAQRAAARKRMPVPPTGYVWTPTNQLRRYHP